MPQLKHSEDDLLLIERVSARAAVDADFRRRLLDDARAGIREATGLVLPERVRVKFVEKDAGADAMFVLPDFIDESGALSAEELEAVAGGELVYTGETGGCTTQNDCVITCFTSCSLTIDIQISR